MTVTVESFSTDEKVTNTITVDGYKDALKCAPEDPYGYWKFKWEKGGEIPALLDGAFTSWPEAEKALRTFEAQQKEKARPAEERAVKAAAKEREIKEQSAKAKAEWDAKRKEA